MCVKSLLLDLGYRVVAPVKYTNGKILKIDQSYSVVL